MDSHLSIYGQAFCVFIDSTDDQHSFSGRSIYETARSNENLLRLRRCFGELRRIFAGTCIVTIQTEAVAFFLEAPKSSVLRIFPPSWITYSRFTSKFLSVSTVPEGQRISMESTFFA